ncbi:MAG: TonB-dependent receptor [Pedobacter sp.]|uniref:TonB-dependent receptor n=1 Tax=Pedobacter sp. TaxID=1411316 RepID=UPI0033998088
MKKNKRATAVLRISPCLKFLRIMKLGFIITLVCSLQVQAAKVYSQNTFSFDIKQAEISTILSAIQHESDYRFFYNNALLKRLGKVNLKVDEAPLGRILNQLLSGRLAYSIDSNVVVISGQVSNESRLTVTGKVLDERGEAMFGVSVKVQGTTNGVSTDASGQFVITAPLNSVLEISYIGYEKQTLTVSSEKSLLITMKPSAGNLNEVIVVGYGTQKKSAVSGAVSEVQTDKLTSRSLGNFTEALQGKTPGVTVSNEGGDPTGKPKVSVRGVGGINGEEPLYVVDGSIYTGTPNLNPNDIESMSVLKDASAAIYGARASGGVILITTKKGKAGKIAVSLDVKNGFQNAWKKVQALDAAQYAAVSNLAADNAGIARNPAFDASVYPDGQLTKTNWVDEVFRTGMQQEYTFGMSGGNETSNFYSGFNYRNTEGILQNTYGRRYNFRLNSSHQITPWLKIGENMFYSNTNGNTASTTSAYTGAIVSALFYPPSVSVYTPSGAFSGLPAQYAGAYGDVINPVAYLQRLDISNPVQDLNINPYAEVTILKDLRFRSNLSITKTSTFFKQFETKVPEIGKIFDFNQLTQESKNNVDLLTEQTLNYDHAFGAHHLNLLGGYTFQKTTNERLYVYARGFDDESENYRYLQNANTIFPSTSEKNTTSLISYIGRVNYDYNAKYLLSLIGRRDGSSLVSEENRFQNYGSVSAGWVLSNEDFLKNTTWLNLLKVRGSYGVLGNLGSLEATSVNPLLSKSQIYMGATPTLTNGYYENVLANPSLTWATSKQTDFGIDAGVLDNRLTLSADYFVKKTDNMIIRKTLTSTTGVESQWVNGGLFRDRGAEFGINYKNKEGHEFQYSMNLTFTKVSNKLLSLPDGNSSLSIDQTVRAILDPIRIQVDQPLYSYYVIQTAGIFQSTDEAKNYKSASGTVIQPNAVAGDLKFVDQNGDGKIDNNDRVYKGSALPDFSYGFSFNANYKNFDINIFAQGVQGSKIFNGIKYMTLNAASGQNYNKDAAILEAWSPTNTGGEIPRVSARDNNGNFSNTSDFYLENGSYLRIKNVTLGYTLHKAFLEKLKMSNMRLYVTANNLFTITKYTGFDPEVGSELNGIDVGRYPQARSVMFGLNVNF